LKPLTGYGRRGERSVVGARTHAASRTASVRSNAIEQLRCLSAVVLVAVVAIGILGGMAILPGIDAAIGGLFLVALILAVGGVLFVRTSESRAKRESLRRYKHDTLRSAPQNERPPRRRGIGVLSTNARGRPSKRLASGPMTLMQRNRRSWQGAETRSPCSCRSSVRRAIPSVGRIAEKGTHSEHYKTSTLWLSSVPPPFGRPRFTVLPGPAKCAHS